MNRFFLAVIVLLIAVSIKAQELKVKAKGEQTFSFEDKGGRNQAAFFSKTMLEDITGVSNEIKGNVSFDVSSVAKTLKGKVLIPAASIKTGISLRDEHLLGEGWIDAKQFPELSFEITKVNKVVKADGNSLILNINGNFMLKGVSKSVSSDFTLTYLDQSEKTKMRADGDLLGVRGKFSIKLSDFGINNKVIGNKVADEIEIDVNIVGSNK
ncbi:MAG: YceI family protein [bacterium]